MSLRLTVEFKVGEINCANNNTKNTVTSRRQRNRVGDFVN